MYKNFIFLYININNLIKIILEEETIYIYIYILLFFFMKVLKTQPIFSIINNNLIDSPSPSNLSYIWGYGSLLGVCLVIQIITGVTLAM
jgi:quinol-cytochrome oxidoreductase complex cytochrome b subunit